jgi:hypothetical protein
MTVVWPSQRSGVAQRGITNSFAPPPGLADDRQTMTAVQITGCSGTGKSTIAAVLTRRGLASIDADDDPLLARFVDPAGAVVAEEPAAPDFAWLARHSWAWNPARLDELIRAVAPATLYVCGGAANEPELVDRFTQVFLLEIDEPTMLARLDVRRE